MVFRSNGNCIDSVKVLVGVNADFDCVLGYHLALSTPVALACVEAATS